MTLVYTSIDNIGLGQHSQPKPQSPVSLGDSQHEWIVTTVGLRAEDTMSRQRPSRDTTRTLQLKMSVEPRRRNLASNPSIWAQTLCSEMLHDQ